MPSSKSTRFDVANFMKTRKEMRQKAVDQSRSLKTELNTINRKINRLKSKPGTHPSTPGGRTRPPTHLVKGKSNLPVRTAVKRRHETMVAASVIHGGSENYPKPALDGIFDTLNKRCKLDSMQQYVLSNETLTDKVVSTVYKKNVSSFEKSSTNVKRSIATFYSSGIMGKRKYQAVRLALSMKKSDRKNKNRSSVCIMPKCPIPKLLTYNNLVHEINKIEIGNVFSVEEYFQDATEDDLVRGCFRKLEEFLPRLAQFYLRKDRKESLKWFGYPQGTLLVALGGDGCPFGKNEKSCSVVKKYVQFLCQEIADLQGKVFDIEGIKGTFGTNGNTMWRPWKYEERVAVANQVDKFKQSLSTKQFPAKQLRTKGILKEAIAKSKLPVSCKKFVDVPKDSPFSQVVTALKFEVKAKCLARKVAKWYDETQGNGQDLQYRFTGKESRLFCHNFMRLIKWLSNEKDTRRQKQTVLTYAYLGLKLRDCVSIFNRFDITAEQITQLTVVAREYFRLNALFMPSAVNPTVWTMGHIIPNHTQGFEDPKYCYCNLEKRDPGDSKCTFCGDPLMDVIQSSVEQGKVLSQMTLTVELNGSAGTAGR
ncbi:hypothetical protein OS493_030898 [Desmophyllum pertusum]|uniref:Uncharacterized protein n=1 Tax=Desmophyllum pertusum TaxID=174260 RepID=A0A9W9ZYQ6_9CNID|nr:hypothetical protein OS493_030898 [Desmophyllum pertusum]